jgi:hypothetical protein
MNQRQSQIFEQLYKAAKAAARKGTVGQGVEPEDIQDLAQDIVHGWTQEHGVTKATTQELLDFAREKNADGSSIFSRARGAAGTSQRREIAGLETGRQEFGSTWVTADPATRCVLMTKSSLDKAAQALTQNRTEREMYTTLYRLHEGQLVYQGQPAQLSKRVRYQSDPSLPREWCTKAQVDLLKYHFKRKSSSCPTCKRIATFIRGVEQEQVEQTVNSLVEQIRIQTGR